MTSNTTQHTPTPYYARGGIIRKTADDSIVPATEVEAMCTAHAELVAALRTLKRDGVCPATWDVIDAALAKVSA